MPIYNKKKLIIILIYISFFITIPIIKNESRLIEKNIQNHKPLKFPKRIKLSIKNNILHLEAGVQPLLQVSVETICQTMTKVQLQNF